jgi:type I restriction enzyme M protein
LKQQLPSRVTLTPLYKMIEPCQTGIQPAYSDSGKMAVINSRHVLTNKIDLSSCRLAHEIDKAALAQPGDVLLNATGAGTLGRASALLSDSSKIFDVCIIRIRPLSIDPVYLAAFLNTKVGQLQIERHTRGSSGQLHLYPRDASKILVWDAPQKLQLEVRQLIEEAHNLEQTSNRLLHQAKARVEQLIEEAAQQ